MLSEQANKCDSHFLNTQNSVVSILTALGIATSALLTKDINRKMLLETLNDAGKLIYDLHFIQLLGRKACVIRTINKNSGNVLQKTKA